MSGLAVAVIEGEESGIRETFRGEGEKRKGETKEQKPQSRDCGQLDRRQPRGGDTRTERHWDFRTIIFWDQGRPSGKGKPG